MSDFKEVGFARALARELYVHNHKDFESPFEAAQDALLFMTAINSVFPFTDVHTRTSVKNDGSNQS